MSADTKSKKRKSGDNLEAATKRVKKARSADTPAPLKSALKSSKVDTGTADKHKKNVRSRSVKTETKVMGNEEERLQLTGSSTNEADAEPSRLTPSQTAALLAGFSSDDEEGEEDPASADEGGIPLSSLPAAPTTSTKSASDPETTPGVIYISRLPHGFFEPQLRSYFSQFGTVTQLRLARNRRTGASRHHAFVGFESAAVADIVARTMDKYLLFGHVLQVRLVPAAQVREEMWKGLKGGRARPRNRIEGAELRMGMGREKWDKRVEREVERRKVKEQKLKELGYDYEMPAVKGVDEVGKDDKSLALGTREEDVIVGAEEGPKARAEKTSKRKTTAGVASGKKTKKAKISAL